MGAKLRLTYFWIGAVLLSCPGLLSAVRGAEFDIRNADEFKKVVPEGSKVEKLASGFKFVEGPTWVGAGYLLFSDIPANEIKKWTAKDGITVFRANSNNSNGNTLDAQGRLVTAQHGSRSVTRTEKDGTVTTLAEKYDGKPFNSPNDVVVKSDGTIWFTDPDYGIPKGQQKEQPGNYVYRLDPKTKEVRALVKDFDKPNGLCFSADEKRLYVADSGKPHHLRVFDVKEDGTVSAGDVFCVIDVGGPDGIRCDADGRIWSSAGDGVHIFAPDGKLIGKILMPQVMDPKDTQKRVRENPANLCFGGEDGKTLFMTARTSLYAIKVSATGASNAKK